MRKARLWIAIQNYKVAFACNLHYPTRENLERVVSRFIVLKRLMLNEGEEQ